MAKKYSELNKLNSLKERFEYLRTNSKVSKETFGGSRYLNQAFYRSPQWQEVRREVILRDNACEMGLKGYPISGRVYIHHINPISKDILKVSPEIALDPENLVCVSEEMHRAIHYGTSYLEMYEPHERKPNDTIPWR